MEQRDAQHTRVRRFRKWESRAAELLPETVSCALLCVSQRDSSAGLRSMDIACNFGDCYKARAALPFGAFCPRKRV